MESNTQRTATRSTHIVLGFALAAFVYLPGGDASEMLRDFLAWIGVPLVAVSGTWLWKGPTVRRALRARKAATS